MMVTCGRSPSADAPFAFPGPVPDSRWSPWCGVMETSEEGPELGEGEEETKALLALRVFMSADQTSHFRSIHFYRNGHMRWFLILEFQLSDDQCEQISQSRPQELCDRKSFDDFLEMMRNLYKQESLKPVFSYGTINSTLDTLPPNLCVSLNPHLQNIPLLAHDLAFIELDLRQAAHFASCQALRLQQQVAAQALQSSSVTEHSSQTTWRDSSREVDTWCRGEVHRTGAGLLEASTLCNIDEKDVATVMENYRRGPSPATSAPAAAASSSWGTEATASVDGNQVESRLPDLEEGLLIEVPFKRSLSHSPTSDQGLIPAMVAPPPNGLFTTQGHDSGSSVSPGSNRGILSADPSSSGGSSSRPRGPIHQVWSPRGGSPARSPARSGEALNPPRHNRQSAYAYVDATESPSHQQQLLHERHQQEVLRLQLQQQQEQEQQLLQQKEQQQQQQLEQQQQQQRAQQQQQQHTSPVHQYRGLTLEQLPSLVQEHAARNPPRHLYERLGDGLLRSVSADGSSGGIRLPASSPSYPQTQTNSYSGTHDRQMRPIGVSINLPPHHHVTMLGHVPQARPSPEVLAHIASAESLDHLLGLPRCRGSSTQLALLSTNTPATQGLPRVSSPVRPMEMVASIPERSETPALTEGSGSNTPKSLQDAQFDSLMGDTLSPPNESRLVIPEGENRTSPPATSFLRQLIDQHSGRQITAGRATSTVFNIHNAPSLQYEDSCVGGQTGEVFLPGVEGRAAMEGTYGGEGHSKDLPNLANMEQGAEGGTIDEEARGLEYAVRTGGSRASRDAKKASKAPTERLAEMSLEELSKNFTMPINQACKVLGVGLTVLKKRCREHGVKRWPHRKIKSLDSLMHSIVDLARVPSMTVHNALEQLNHQKRLLQEVPGSELAERTLRLRQACFKASYKRRKHASSFSPDVSSVQQENPLQAMEEEAALASAPASINQQEEGASGYETGVSTEGLSD